MADIIPFDRRRARSSSLTPAAASDAASTDRAPSAAPWPPLDDYMRRNNGNERSALIDAYSDVQDTFLPFGGDVARLPGKAITPEPFDKMYVAAKAIYWALDAVGRTIDSNNPKEALRRAIERPWRVIFTFQDKIEFQILPGGLVLFVPVDTTSSDAVAKVIQARLDSKPDNGASWEKDGPRYIEYYR